YFLGAACLGVHIAHITSFFFFKQKTAYEIGLGIPAEPLFRSRSSISDDIRNILCGMALLILALLQRIFLMSSLMLLLVWLIFFMVLIKLLPILGTISGKTVKLMVLALDRKSVV